RLAGMRFTLLFACSCAASPATVAKTTGAELVQMSTMLEANASLASAPKTVPINQTEPCAQGGTATLVGQLEGSTDESGTTTYSVDLMATFVGCELADGPDVQTDAALTTSGEIDVVTTAISKFTVTYRGEIRADGNPCNVDVTVTLPGATSGGTHATGAVCGQ